MKSIPGWWFQPTPLKNGGVRQLGLLFPTEWKVINFMFQTTNQIQTMKQRDAIPLDPWDRPLSCYNVGLIIPALSLWMFLVGRINDLPQRGIKNQWRRDTCYIRMFFCVNEPIISSMMFHAMFWHLRSSKLPIAVKNHHFVCFFNKKSILFPQQTVC